MTDREPNPTATLGRVMSWIGSLWVVFSVLWGMGALQSLGISGPIASGIGETIVPAIVLIGVGRVLRKRARVDQDVIVPDVSPAPRPTPPILPRPQTRVDFPPPAGSSAPKPPPRTVTPQKAAVVTPVEVTPDADPAPEISTNDLDPTPGAHKSSQELIEEARRRWGTRP